MDVDELKMPAIQRIFRAWFEDWETDNLRKQDCVIEAKFLTKYKDLVFLDPDSGSTFTVASQNCEYHHRRTGGWYLICEPNDEEDGEPEAWNIELANELIGKTKKLEGVEIVAREVYKVNIKT